MRTALAPQLSFVALSVALSVALFLAACPFDARLPPGAVVICVDDADCPLPTTCDTAAHECKAPGDDVRAPVLVSAIFDPPIASSGTVTLVVTADEDLDGAPVLSFDGPDPGFAVASNDGPVARFGVDVAALAPGAYPLQSIVLVDGAGNSATRLTPSTVLIIDRSAPSVLALEVTHAGAASGGDAAALPFSTNPGSNTIAIAFLLDESVAATDVTVTAGSLSTPDDVTCERTTSTRYTCAATVVASAFTDIADRVSVRVVDGAGNEGGADVTIALDLAAPVVVDAPFVIRRPGASDAIGAAVDDSVVEVELVVDEPLGALPVPALIGDVTAGNATVTQLTPVRFALALPVQLVGAAGSASLEVALVDVVGNATVHAVADIALALAIQSQCVAPTPQACVDFDGDGEAAISATCGASGSDCDDTNALVRSDLIDLPGDGLDNDCAGDGDAIIDESIGVFVDSSAAPGGTGTRASPANNLSDADALRAGRPFLFLAFDAADDYDVSGLLDASLLGGLDASTWERVPGQRSEVFHSGGALSNDNIVLDSVRLSVPEGLTITAPTTLTRTHLIAFTIVLAPLSFVDGLSKTGMNFQQAGPGSLLERVVIEDEINVSDSDVLFHRCDGGDFLYATRVAITAGSGADVTIVNSAAGGVACDGCDALRVFHSLLIGEPQAASMFRINLLAPGGTAVLGNSILLWRAGAPSPAGQVFISTDVAIDVWNNLFDARISPPAFYENRMQPFTLDTLAELNTFGTSGDVERNITGTALFTADEVHAGLNSPVIDAGRPLAGFDVVAGIDVLAADIDGACRSDAPDIGPDER